MSLKNFYNDLHKIDVNLNIDIYAVTSNDDDTYIFSIGDIISNKTLLDITQEQINAGKFLITISYNGDALIDIFENGNTFKLYEEVEEEYIDLYVKMLDLFWKTYYTEMYK